MVGLLHVQLCQYRENLGSLHGIPFSPSTHSTYRTVQTMYTIENPMSPCFVELINCYSQAVNYLAGINGSDPLYGSASGRDMGLLIYGDLFNSLMTYNLAIMNGQGINLKDKTIKRHCRQPYGTSIEMVVRRRFFC